MRSDNNLYWLGLSFFLWAVGYNIGAPILPLWAEQLGAQGAQIGTVLAAMYAGAAVFGLSSGPLSDRIGYRRVLIAAWIISAVGASGLAQAGTWVWLIPAAFFSIAGAGALPALNALIVASTEPEKRGRVFAMIYIAGPIGLLLGAPVGAWVADVFGFRITYLAAAICLAGATLLLLPLQDRAVPNPVVETNETKRSWGSMAIIIMLIAGSYFFVALPASYMVPYLHEIAGWSVAATGLFNSWLAFSQLAWSLVVAIGLPDLGSLKITAGKAGTWSLPTGIVLGLGIALLANGIFGLLLPASFGAMLYLAIFLRGSFYVLQSLGSALVGEVGTGNRIATRFTAVGLAIAVATAMASFIGGWLYSIQPALPFQINGLASLAGSCLLLALLLFIGRSKATGRQEQA